MNPKLIKNPVVIITTGGASNTLLRSVVDKSVTSIDASDLVGATKIGAYVFWDCTQLANIAIPNSVLVIDDYAFHGCRALQNFTIPNSVTRIGNEVFYYCESLTAIVIPDSVTDLGWSAFWGCSGLTNVTLSNNITEIKEGTFHGCSALANITIPNGVTRIGNSAFLGCTSLTSITIPFVGATRNGTSNTHFGYIFGAPSHFDNHEYVPASLRTVVITGGTSIGEGAFHGCDGLTSITIPDSVTSIGYGAFDACTGLTSIVIPDSVTSVGGAAFAGCSGLTSVTLGDSVTSIENSVFQGCTGLTSVTIPDSVTSIGNYAFQYCTNLTSITIPNNVTSIGDYAFYGCSGLTDIYYQGTEDEWNAISKGYNWDASTGNYTIHFVAESEGLSFVSNGDGTCYLTGIGTCEDTDIVIPLHSYDNDVVTGVENEAFQSEYDILSVLIPSSVTSIGARAFQTCISLMRVTFSASSQLTSIGNAAFQDCRSLASITIPDSVTSIGNHAFDRCLSLANVTIPDSVTSIGNSMFENCNNLTSVTIPDGVTSIGERTFSGCNSLTSATIGNSVTSIGNSAFAGCGLTSITIPDGVTSIGDYALSGCNSLMSITIGDGVTNIGHYTFNYCSALTSITIKAVTPPVLAIGYSAFSNTNDCPILVPVGSVPAYKTAWAPLADRIRAMEYSVGLAFTSTGDDTCAVSGIGTCADTYISIPATVSGFGEITAVKSNAFLRGSITGAEIPNSVTTIQSQAFALCRSMKYVLIGESVTTIDWSAFYGCSALTSLTIPSSVRSIGYGAFTDCSALTSITVKATTPPTLADAAVLNNTNSCPIYVPAGSVNAYLTDNVWSQFANRIQAIT